MALQLLPIFNTMKHFIGRRLGLLFSNFFLTVISVDFFFRKWSVGKWYFDVTGGIYFSICPALLRFFVNYIILSQPRTAVDTEEIYDYLEYVEKPMDFDQMLTKLDNGEYHCAQDFLDDIDLVADNAVKYNSDLNYETNKVLCHRAKSLQDFAYALIKADMDTDFEDNCKVFTV